MTATDAEIPEDVKKRQLRRLFEPKSIAIVGADESNPYAKSPLGTLDSDADVYFVSQRSDSFFGHRTYSSLTEVGVPIDAVFSMMSAQRTTVLAEEAAQLNVGGLITIAGGFAEQGKDGADLQNRLREAGLKGSMPIIGPNGVGYINVPKKFALTMMTNFGRRSGGVSLITHSGAVLEAIASSAWRAGGVGFNMLISSGNEPITDMADYLDYLVDDSDTEIICLVVEKIRRPKQFFDAAARARLAGKPIVAVKLARTERTQRMAQSHTGALTGDTWVYDQAFKQAGIIRADEVDEMVDRVQLMEQIPRERWTPVKGLFVLTATGGFAAMSADLAEAEGVDIPDVQDMAQWVGTVLPGTTVANPLDATGFAVNRPEVFRQLLDEYSKRPEFDALIFFHQVAEWDSKSVPICEIYAEHAMQHGRPAVISPVAGLGGRWLDALRTAYDIGVGNGIRGSLRGFNTMATFMRSRNDAKVTSAEEVEPVTRSTSQHIDSEIGNILSFRDTMELLEQFGIPVARFHIVDSNSLAEAPFPGPYVVKLADVAHRTEHNAVRIGVTQENLPEVVENLRVLAKDSQLPDVVAVQEMIAGSGEAFIGMRGSSELGPVVAFGLGGVFVEILHRVSGRMAPLSKEDAIELISEFDDTGVLDGARGKDPWDRGQLTDILVAAGQLAATGRNWIDTLDINPLIFGEKGFVAVDGLCLLKDV
jgi:acetate---CoA ligase (ADP-forming)